MSAAPAPANGLGRPPPSMLCRTAVAAVQDPNPASKPSDRIQATVNLRDNVLEAERSAGRISEAAYRVGLALQEIYEGRRERDEPNDKVDVSTTPDAAMLSNLAWAQRLVSLEGHIQRQVGERGKALLRAVLGEGRSFASIAAQRSRMVGARRGAPTASSGRHAGTSVGAEFRDMLEQIAASWQAVGAS